MNPNQKLFLMHVYFRIFCLHILKYIAFLVLGPTPSETRQTHQNVLRKMSPRQFVITR